MCLILELEYKAEFLSLILENYVRIIYDVSGKNGKRIIK